MSIRFDCPQCGQRLSVGSRKAGGESKCPKCRQVIRVPADSTPPPANEERTASVTGDQEPELVPPQVFAEPGAEFQLQLQLPRSDHEAGPPLPVDYDKVAVPRSVLYVQGVLLGVVALVSFALGMIVGGGSTTRTAVQPQNENEVYALSGRVSCRTDRDAAGQPDPGSVVIVLPRGTRMTDKAMVEGLSPEAPEPPRSHAGLATIRRWGGAYERTDARGEFRVTLPRAGSYYVLFISRSARRSSGESISPSDLAQMSDYFVGATELVGDSRYRWEVTSVQRPKTLDVLF